MIASSPQNSACFFFFKLSLDRYHPVERIDALIHLMVGIRKSSFWSSEPKQLLGTHKLSKEIAYYFPLFFVLNSFAKG